MCALPPSSPTSHRCQRLVIVIIRVNCNSNEMRVRKLSPNGQTENDTQQAEATKTAAILAEKPAAATRIASRHVRTGKNHYHNIKYEYDNARLTSTHRTRWTKTYHWPFVIRRGNLKAFVPHEWYVTHEHQHLWVPV